MSRARVLVYTLLACAVLFTSACNRGEIKGELQAQYDAMNAALKERDSKKFGEVLANDFQQVGFDKKTYTKAQMIDLANAQFKETTEFDSKSTVDSATLSGDRADSTATTTQKITFKEPTTDKTHVLDIVSKSKDVWHKEGNAWKLVQSTETDHTGTMDGKPIEAAKK